MLSRTHYIFQRVQLIFLITAQMTTHCSMWYLSLADDTLKVLKFQGKLMECQYLISCCTWFNVLFTCKSLLQLLTLILQITTKVLQYWSLLNWQNLQLHCGCVAVPVNWFFDIISSFFAKFKNVVHSLESVETPSKSASHQAPNYVQRS